MKPISINIARDIAFGVDNEGSDCDKCIFYGRISCTLCECSVGNVLKRLVDEDFLSIDESFRKVVAE